MRRLRSPHNLVILAGVALGAIALSVGMPDPIPPPLGLATAGRTIWLGGPMVAFLLPAAVAIIDTLLRGLCIREPIDELDAPTVLRIYDAIMLRIIVFVMAVHGTVLLGVSGLLGGRAWAGRIVPSMLGLTLISIGNLLPRTRPNLAIGIRTRRVLADRALWIRIHRSAGYIVVMLGCVVVFSAMFVPPPAGPGMILAAGPAALVGTCAIVRSSKGHGDVNH